MVNTSQNSTFKVAGVQMNCMLGNKTKNLQKAKELILQAHSNGAELVVLPELFNTGYRVEEKDWEFAETIPGETSEFISRLAQENKMYIVAGIIERGPIEGTVFDTAFLATPTGQILSYRKMHLWDNEKNRFLKGANFVVWPTEIGLIGPQICYEVGFPEGARVLALKGAKILVYPSAFGEARFYAWDLATRSRALENGVYLIATNRSGNEKGETAFCGHSRIVDPLGKVLQEAVNEDDVIFAEIDLSKVASQRRAIPYLRDLNTEAYIKELSKNKLSK